MSWTTDLKTTDEKGAAVKQVASDRRNSRSGAFTAKKVTRELREASDDVIEGAVKFADPMVLRGLLYQLTGDEAVAAMETTASTELLWIELQTIADQGDVAVLRQKTVDLLKAFREQRGDEVPLGRVDRLPRTLELVIEREIQGCELEMWEEQTGLDPWARGINWVNRPEPDELERFSVCVIGAGMGGLNAGVMLKKAGLPFTILEKNAEVGGTWHENRYPGARVDNPSRTYSHVYGADFDWRSVFATQPENERYFNWIADEFGVRERIEFETEVDSVVWDEEASKWEVRAEGPNGERVVHANAVFSAVGFLSRPNVPEIEGIERFRGRAFHTAQWPSDLNLSGKRVAVVGSGCTGYQLVPAIVEEVEQTFVFQRKPNWCFGIDGYLADLPPEATWLDRNLPYYTNLSRFRQCWLVGPESRRASYEIDPNFEDEHTRSPLNKQIREERLDELQKKLGSRPDLLEKMTPLAPPLSARPVLCDRSYSVLDTLLRDDVELVDTGIRRVTESGIETRDGREIPLDVIVFATGFKANDFLWPMKVRGRGGKSVEELWAKDGPRAYLGAMLPGFPNFFVLYGPNTNPYAGGDPADFEEYVTRFALECFRGLIESGRRTVDVSDDAYWRFNEEVDRWEEIKIYMDPRASSYFQNGKRSPGNAPIDMRKIWAWLRSPTGPRPGEAPIWSAGPVEESTEIRPYFDDDLIVE